MAVSPIEPIDFLDAYLTNYGRQKGLTKKQHGWRGKAEQCLSDALQVPTSTIHKWGAEFENRPDWVPTALGSLHALRQIKKLASE